jgi:Tol biopolymer transport system component
MDSNGENEIRLTFNDSDDYYSKFSNNKNKIVFTSKPRDKPHFRIWTMDADGLNLEQLTDTQAYGCDWSPDGKYIVYTDARAENGRLWIMDADGSNKRQLTFEHHFINF